MIDVYFRNTLLFLRFGGIQIKLQSVSTINRVYCEMLTMCYYITLVSIIMDFVFKNEDMKEPMKKVRMIFALFVVAWMLLYLR